MVRKNNNLMQSKDAEALKPKSGESQRDVARRYENTLNKRRQKEEREAREREREWFERQQRQQQQEAMMNSHHAAPQGFGNPYCHERREHVQYQTHPLRPHPLQPATTVPPMRTHQQRHDDPSQAVEEAVERLPGEREIDAARRHQHHMLYMREYRKQQNEKQDRA